MRRPAGLAPNVLVYQGGPYLVPGLGPAIGHGRGPHGQLWARRARRRPLRL